MPTIPFGPFRPDRAGIDTNIILKLTNAAPAAAGYQPIGALSPTTEALTEPSLGAASFLDPTGSGITFSGTKTGLFKLAADNSWTNVTRLSGPYDTAAGEQWFFDQFGDLGIATNFSNVVQKIDLTDPAAVFEDLGGSPPQARYVAVVGNHLQLGNLFDGVSTLLPDRVQWSALNNPEEWIPAQNSSGLQDFPNGGPVRGMLGGELGFIFQSQGIRRQVSVPASDLVFRFDKIESGRGLLAPGSLVHLGRRAFFLDRDGFFLFDIATAQSIPVGVDKVDRFFDTDKRANTDLLIRSGFDPTNHFIFWSYISKDTATNIANRVILYNWATQEWGSANLQTTSFLQFVTSRLDMDSPEGLDSIDDMDSLAFSLDSPLWSGGNVILGVFGVDNSLSNLTGQPLEAKFETSDAQLNPDGRFHLEGLTPAIEASQIFGQIGYRERLSDQLVFTTEEGVQSTGQIPFHVEGRYMRARVRIPKDQVWFLAQGINPVLSPAGSR